MSLTSCLRNTSCVFANVPPVAKRLPRWHLCELHGICCVHVVLGPGDDLDGGYYITNFSQVVHSRPAQCAIFKASFWNDPNNGVWNSGNKVRHKIGMNHTSSSFFQWIKLNEHWVNPQKREPFIIMESIAFGRLHFMSNDVWKVEAQETSRHVPSVSNKRRRHDAHFRVHILSLDRVWAQRSSAVTSTFAQETLLLLQPLLLLGVSTNRLGRSNGTRSPSTLEELTRAENKAFDAPCCHTKCSKGDHVDQVTSGLRHVLRKEFHKSVEQLKVTTEKNTWNYSKEN